MTTGYNDYGETSGKTIAYYTDGTVTDTYGYEYTYEADIRRRLKETSVNGYTEKYTYDVSGRRQAVERTLGGHTYGKRYVYYKAGDCATERVSTVYETKDGITSGKTTYTYDAKGNIVSVNKNGKQIEVYEYDRLDRLVREKKLDKNEEREYTYDDKGNLLRKTADGEVKEYRYEAGSDRMARYGSESCLYDGIGNPTTYRGKTAVWSKGRQLQSITAGAETVTFSYDGRGQRTGKTAGSVTRTYVYDNGTLLREISGTEKTDYLYGSEGITGFIVNGTKYLYGKNIFGDIEEIYDAAGNVVGRYSYTAYGEVTVETDVDGIATRNPIRYRGYYYDTETGLYYLKNRYYDPEVGRFITIDDISYLDPETINGLNLYAYCGNNPVMRTDPNGTSWWSDLWNTIAAIAIVVGIVALVAVTAGGAAIALGASTAMVSAIAMGATVGGLVAGAMEIGTQLINNGYGNIDLGSVALETFGGAAYGAISGVMNATTSGLVRLGMRGAVVALNTGMSGIRTAMNGGSAADILRSMGVSLATGLISQGFFVGMDYFGRALTTFDREWMVLHKALFNNAKLFTIAGVQIFKGILKNVSPLIAEIWRNII